MILFKYLVTSLWFLYNLTNHIMARYAKQMTVGSNDLPKTIQIGGCDPIID